MKKLMMILLLSAGLAACGSETPKPAEKAPEPPAATKETPAPETPEPPKADTAAKDAKTPAPEPAKEPAKKAAAETKPEPKAPAKAADTKPADVKPASNLKPGLYAHFETSLGNFTAELNEKEAPGTVASFAGLADGTKPWTDPKTGKQEKKPYYDGLIFHRVIDGFMIQGGDPLGTGSGGPGFTIKDESNSLKHDKTGTLAMARTKEADSAGSQFYVTVVPTPFLDNQRPPYVVFGQVVEGLDVVLKIGKVPTAPGDRPLTPVTIKKIRTERIK